MQCAREVIVTIFGCSGGGGEHFPPFEGGRDGRFNGWITVCRRGEVPAISCSPSLDTGLLPTPTLYPNSGLRRPDSGLRRPDSGLCHPNSRHCGGVKPGFVSLCEIFGCFVST